MKKLNKTEQIKKRYKELKESGKYKRQWQILDVMIPEFGLTADTLKEYIYKKA